MSAPTTDSDKQTRANRQDKPLPDLTIDLNKLSLEEVHESSGTKNSAKLAKTPKSNKSRLPVSNNRISGSRSESRQSPESGGGLVPSIVTSIHNSHLATCPNVRPNVQSATTPSSESTLSTCTLSSVSAKKQITGISNERFRYEEYMPLCEIQKLMAKGQVIEVNFWLNFCARLIN